MKRKDTPLSGRKAAREKNQTRASVAKDERALCESSLRKPLIGSDLQVAATRQDQEDLWVIDWQQYTARREDDHDDIEQMATFGLSETKDEKLPYNSRF